MKNYKASSSGHPIINGISLKYLYCKDIRNQALRGNSNTIFKFKSVFRSIFLFIPLKSRFVASFFTNAADRLSTYI
ncbi:MAG TPA: hypothetical protein VD815_00280 [Candidatus Saccharimonadales bacterium]|nr:hypothetical protein [Candidatus Saccharimonadales bacterium]